MQSGTLKKFFANVLGNNSSLQRAEIRFSSSQAFGNEQRACRRHLKSNTGLKLSSLSLLSVLLRQGLSCLSPTFWKGQNNECLTWSDVDFNCLLRFAAKHTPLFSASITSLCRPRTWCLCRLYFHSFTYAQFPLVHLYRHRSFCWKYTYFQQSDWLLYMETL